LQFAYYLIQCDDHATLVVVIALKGKKAVDRDVDTLTRNVLLRLAAQMRSVWACEPKA
jgi:hypothetical protein